VVKVHLVELVDPNYVAIASIGKKLPAEEVAAELIAARRCGVSNP
jgi:hypothetical protein